jgi:FtsP/CotA-like multicopper oxidase with cupredoxin domain
MLRPSRGKTNLGPGTYATFDWLEDNPGDWMHHCHVPTHFEGGMRDTYGVSK